MGEGVRERLFSMHVFQYDKLVVIDACVGVRIVRGGQTMARVLERARAPSMKVQVRVNGYVLAASEKMIQLIGPVGGRTGLLRTRALDKDGYSSRTTLQQEKYFPSCVAEPTAGSRELNTKGRVLVRKESPCGIILQ